MEKTQINSVFLPCNDEPEELEPIKFTVPASYNDKVKIHDWQMHTLAEPKDNRDIFPPKGNLQSSTYRRLGLLDTPMGVSETHDMLSQIELKDLYTPIFPHRSYLNIRSFARTDKGEEDEENLKLTDVIYNTEEIRCMDYRTTTETEYRAPYPMKSRPLPPPPPPKPWLLNRRTISYTLDELGKRDGIITFLDDNMELHHKIADLKKQRNKTRDILSIIETSPNSSDKCCPCSNQKKHESKHQDIACHD
ncbi:hypothetical protein KPH14_012059 [Odynerus spinipes]|uniref:Uncharacterized protein n=1 Tax=Odynerus spinipes TaxID=1348599 RepID=A0AAD9RA79_9HYME|nr:hypothetical protein KPH14_012059 [Odynerus spinipes]